jgi:hypothetical protein
MAVSKKATWVRPESGAGLSYDAPMAAPTVSDSIAWVARGDLAGKGDAGSPRFGRLTLSPLAFNVLPSSILANRPDLNTCCARAL